MAKFQLQANISVPEEQLLRSLAEVSGHSMSLIAARAITEWLQHNYRDQLDLYANATRFHLHDHLHDRCQKK